MVNSVIVMAATMGGGEENGEGQVTNLSAIRESCADCVTRHETKRSPDSEFPLETRIFVWLTFHLPNASFEP